MEELRKLVFEKIKFDKLKMNKSDYVTLVAKGQELGIEEPKIKKMVSSCLKSLKTFKGKTLPLSILEEKNVALEADELYIPADILEAWRDEAKERLKELEKILALNKQEELQTFLAQNPELESVLKTPLSQFVKVLHENTNYSEQKQVIESDIHDNATKNMKEAGDVDENKATYLEQKSINHHKTVEKINQIFLTKKIKKAIIALLCLLFVFIAGLCRSIDSQEKKDFPTNSVRDYAHEEQERLAAEETAREEQERLAAEEAAREEQERLAAEETRIPTEVKLSNLKSIDIQYNDGHEDIFTKEKVHSILKQNKADLQQIYLNLLKNWATFDATFKICLMVNLSNGDVVNVQDISKEKYLSEKGHSVLFKKMAVKIKKDWNFGKQHTIGTANISFSIKFIKL